MDTNTTLPEGPATSPPPQGQVKKGVDNDVAEFVEKKVSEARASMSENLIRMLIGLAGLFGVIVPIILSINLNSRVDSAIKDMETKFEKLSVSLNPRSEIRAYSGNASLDGARLLCDSLNTVLRFVVKNEGHATAKSVRILLMTNLEVEDLESPSGETYWSQSYGQQPEELGYRKMFRLYSGNEFRLDVEETRQLEIVLPVTNLQAGEYQNMLKVYCENEPPRRYKFVILVQRV